MAEPSKDKFKYRLLKLIDISGFKVLDPPIRLAFGEDPKKQVREISRYMLLPMVFVGFCVLIWHIAAPNHKTKSGAVPTPGRILESFSDNSRFNEREDEIVADFNATGKEREERLTYVKEELVLLQKMQIELEEESNQLAAQGKEKEDAKLTPYKAELDTLKATIKANKTLRKEKEAALSEKISLGEAQPSELVALFATHSTENEEESTKKQEISGKIKEIRDNPPEEIKSAKLAANKVADEVQHFKKRINILESINKEVAKETLISKIEEDKAALAAATDPKEISKLAKSISISESNLTKLDEKKQPRNATIFWQTYRSLATVFVGFVLATAVAVPIGIMCGLNRIVMACLTPIISIFRPVSPVVWLLIFQIIVGAFFLPDPAKHPIFKFFNASWNPLSFLQVNPAMIFSACTVAMCALWPALVNTALGVSAIDKDHLNVARVLKLGFWSQLFKIIIPSSLPLVFAGLRISLGVGWMVLIAAEALSSSDGLGKFVWDEYQNGSSQSFANIILACFIVGIIGFFLDRIMIVLQRLVSFDDGSATA
ncbi:MAG: ABC transporter permease subunit [Akkermansiaceae bacterium]